MLSTNDLELVLADAPEYPSNLPKDLFTAYSIIGFKQELSSRKGLFSRDEDAELEIWDLYRRDEGYHASQLRSSEELKTHLMLPLNQHRPDPKCRVMQVYKRVPVDLARSLTFERFIHCRKNSARDPLRVTKTMFLQLMSYHLVMPSFLEYILPFGLQHFRLDAFGGTFRSETRMESDVIDASLPELGRSCQQLEFCYNLQAPERRADSYSPWSLRQCSLHHAFDLRKERSTWLLVKGNQIMKSLLKKRLDRQQCHSTDDIENLCTAFRTSLDLHLAVGRWSVENWHFYLRFNEQRLQADDGRRTRSVFLHHADKVGNAQATFTIIEPRQTFGSTKTNYTQKARRVLSGFGSPRKGRKGTVNSIDEQEDPATGQDSQVGKAVTVQPTEFTFENLQATHEIEKKALEASCVLQSNAVVLSRLSKEYEALVDSPDCPHWLRDKCATDVKRFRTAIDGLKSELNLQHMRAEVLLRLVQERKEMLTNVFAYRNMEATQLSAAKMEALTARMHLIARQTQIETVSMRVITVVTLFFLPGTFISTLMSTPIVSFSNEDRSIANTRIGGGALAFYVAVSVPLMLLTFGFWLVLYRRELRKDGEKLASSDNTVDDTEDWDN